MHGRRDWQERLSCGAARFSGSATVPIGAANFSVRGVCLTQQSSEGNQNQSVVILGEKRVAKSTEKRLRM